MAKGGKREGAGSKPQGDQAMVKTGFSMPPELSAELIAKVDVGKRSKFNT